MIGMTYIRGDKAQFDAWEDFGNPGWNWDTMFKYYKQLENFVEPTPEQAEVGASFDPEVHGSDGEVTVGFTPILQNGSLYGTAEGAWIELGQDVNEDVNNGVTQGFGVWPQLLDPVENKRSDAATAFLWPVEDRTNLKLVNGTATRVLWKENSEEPQVESVEYTTHDNETLTVHAKKEVILSAGALRSPLILEASGVGNPKFLEQLGIETVIDLPGVGENLIDQPNNAIIYQGNGEVIADGYSPYATFATAKDLFGNNAETVAKDTKEKLSQYAEEVASWSNGALDASALEQLFEIQHRVMFEEETTIVELLTTAQMETFVSAYWILMPFSRGSVHLKSASDLGTPIIDPRYFHIPLDFDSQIEAGRLATKFWESSGLVESGTVALPGNATDAEWKAFVSQTSSSNSHHLASAAMMKRELGGVVDPELRVYGAKGLRVVDASVLPMQFSGHLCATLYAVAQRASEMILS